MYNVGRHYARKYKSFNENFPPGYRKRYGMLLVFKKSLLEQQNVKPVSIVHDVTGTRTLLNLLHTLYKYETIF